MVDSALSEEFELAGEDRAKRRVDRFVARFSADYYELVCHAALPLVLTPELVSYLRNEFLPGLPWMAEVDFLLSDLCSPVGYELYAMDMEVRAYVLKAGSQQFDQRRMGEVANLLISYVKYLSENSSQMSDRELESQQWAALMSLGESDKRKAVDEMVARFQGYGAAGVPLGAELVHPAELAQLAQLIESFSGQLGDYPVLLEFAALVNDVLLHNAAIEEARVEQAYEVVPGQQLALPSSVKEDLRSRNQIQFPQASTQSQSSGGAGFGDADSPLPAVDFEQTSVEFPPLEVLSFQKGELVESERLEEESAGSLPLEVFEFETAKIRRQRAGLFRRTQQAQARRMSERLTDELALEMVLIPGGHFLMGSPEDEPERYSVESPVHRVTVPSFLMGRYPVTQSQWRFVAGLPQIERELEVEPSGFKGEDRPVERVSWYDTVEFCQRLSHYTDRSYRLPTEAEWEYACRANTTTPFHFGETITTDLANYCGQNRTTSNKKYSGSYGSGPKGIYREETTSVDLFEYANSFGLSNMHGNVWEWCHDYWHKNYVGAPTDGSAWLTEAEYERRRVLRGGSWISVPEYCRSACRNLASPVKADYFIGFRVSCSAPRT